MIRAFFPTALATVPVSWAGRGCRAASAHQRPLARPDRDPGVPGPNRPPMKPEAGRPGLCRAGRPSER